MPATDRRATDAEHRQPQAGGRATRSLTLSSRSYNASDRTVEAILSAGSPVRRSYFTEELEISSAAIDLGRVERGICPLLDTHNQYQLDAVLGRITDVRIQSGQLIGTLNFADTDAGRDIEARVARGELRAISIGYRVTKWVMVEADDAGHETWRAVAWELLEASLVPVPADPNAVVRSDDGILAPLDRTNDMIRNAPSNSDTAPAPAAGGERARRPLQTVTVEQIRERCGRTDDLSRAFERSLIDDHAEHPFTRAQLDQAISDELVRIRETPSIDARDARRGDSPSAGMARAMEDALFARMSGTAPSAEGRDFMGVRLLDMARGLLEARGEPVRWQSPARLVDSIARFGAHTTSDFPILMGNAARRFFLHTLEQYPAPLRPIVKPRSAVDFRQISLAKLGVNPSLLLVRENAEFQRGSVVEAKEGYSLNTYGRIFAVTRQALINDDLGGFVTIFQGWARAAAELEATLIAGLLTANPTMDDGQQLYSNAHSNIAGSGGAISITTLGAARQAMRLQKDLDGSTLVGATPKYLVVGAAKETEAEQALAEIAAATVGDANPFSSKLTLLVDPRITGNSWRLFADPNLWPVIEIARLEGQDDVFVDTRVGFDVDGVETKARVDIGGAAVDWRGTYLNPGN